MTKDAAVRLFADMLNEIPLDMVDDLMSAKKGGFRELTFPVESDLVEYNGQEWTVVRADSLDKYVISNRDDEEKTVSYYDLYFSRANCCPAWDAMFMFAKKSDDDWLENDEHLFKMSQIGFKVFDSEYGYVFGMDTCGTDFYKEYWTPLYDLMGKAWHDN